MNECSDGCRVDIAPSEQVALSELLHWLDENLEDPSLTLAGIARRATVSVRTLSRKFRASVGTAPIQWLFIARVRRAQSLLETTTLGVERIAASVGFGSVAVFRGHFRRVVGTSPQAYRRAFQAIP